VGFFFAGSVQTFRFSAKNDWAPTRFRGGNGILQIIKNIDLRAAYVYVFWIRNSSDIDLRCAIFYILQKFVFPSRAVIDAPLPTRPECSVHKNVDNLTPFRINFVFRPVSSSRTRNPEFHFMERRGHSSHRMAILNLVAHPRTISGTHFRYSST
jgi:hypothetical protein